MKKMICFWALLLTSIASSAQGVDDFDIVGTWYEYETDQEGIENIWTFYADNTGTRIDCDYDEYEEPKGPEPFTYTFDKASSRLVIFTIEDGEDDQWVMDINIVSATEFTYSEGHDVLLWIKQGGGNSDAGHAVSAKATSFKLATSKDGLTYSFEYDNMNRISLIRASSDEGAYDMNVTYEADKVTIQSEQQGMTASFTYTIANDRVVKEVLAYSNQQVSMVYGTLDYSYDSDNHLVKIVGASEYDPNACFTADLTWQDGNIKSAAVNGASGNITLQFDYYGDHFDQTLVQTFSGPLSTIFDETGATSTCPFLACENYLGTIGQNLQKTVYVQEANSSKTINVTYEFDGNGLVTLCNYGNEQHVYTWDSTSTLVASPIASRNVDESYSLDGRRQTGLKRGLNIVRRADGSVVKMMK